MVASSCLLSIIVSGVSFTTKSPLFSEVLPENLIIDLFSNISTHVSPIPHTVKKTSHLLFH
jgi:hypothetical protein